MRNKNQCALIQLGIVSGGLCVGGGLFWLAQTNFAEWLVIGALAAIALASITLLFNCQPARDRAAMLQQLQRYAIAVILLGGLAGGLLLSQFSQKSVSLILFLLALLLIASGLILLIREHRQAATSVPLPPEEKRAPPVPRACAWLTQIRTDGALHPRVSWNSITRPEARPWLFFALSLVVYALTRLIALDQFPIYFFTDEAIHPVHAADLIQRGFRDDQGNLFPSYFQNGQYWNLSLSVYIHALSVFFFGKSILVTRATSAVISLFGAAAVGLILKSIFRIRMWWGAVLFLAATPAWFLHSRTAFETGLMVSFYAWFLLCYLLYRYRSPRYLFPALVFGAATFYSYANGQSVMVVSGVLFLISDLRYHLRHWQTGLWGVQLLAWLVLPYVRFQQQHPDVLTSQLHVLSSYWLEPISPAEKIKIFLSTYAYGLSPQYWFFPNNQDLARHQMNDYGNLGLWAFPFFFLALGMCVRSIRSSAHRAILVAALAAPFGSALVNVAITRALMFVVPASMLATLGLDGMIGRFNSKKMSVIAPLTAFGTLSLVSFFMLGDALTNGPTWSHDYGLYGMQWGAKQLFAEAIPDQLRHDPKGHVYVTSTWANGTDVFLRFFKLDESRVQMYNVDYFLAYQHELDLNAIFIMTGDEYVKARTSGKFKPITIERTLKYPDDIDGFYFAHLAYVDNVDQIFAEERTARHLITETLTLDGVDMQISHSEFDMGQLQNIFDGDPFTLARGMEANPLIIEFVFAQPRPIHSIAGIFGRMNFQWAVLLFADESDAPITYSATYADLPGEPHVEMKFDRGPAAVTKIHLEILNPEAGAQTHIHIRELTLR